MLTQEEANALQPYEDTMDKAWSATKALLAKAKAGEQTSPTAFKQLALTLTHAAIDIGVRAAIDATD